jgi:hypothetical protein
LKKQFFPPFYPLSTGKKEESLEKKPKEKSIGVNIKK